MKRLPVRSPDQGVGAVVVGEVFAAERGDGHQAVRARVLQTNEQAEPRHASDPPGEGRADVLFQIGGDVAIHGVALGGHRPALGHGHALGDGRQFGDLAVGQSVTYPSPAPGSGRGGPIRSE